MAVAAWADHHLLPLLWRHGLEHPLCIQCQLRESRSSTLDTQMRHLLCWLWDVLVQLAAWGCHLLEEGAKREQRYCPLLLP